MKNIKKILLSIISLLLIPIGVNAANANFSISAPAQGIVGNNITVTVTMSSSTPMGAWELALLYDKSYLQLSSAPEGANGTHVAGYVSGSTGVKSKSFTYKFKVLKTGTTTVSTTSTDVAPMNGDGNSLSVSNGSKRIVLKTQAEIEASYSANDNLKNLTVDNYSLSPSFDKNTLEYSLEVENDVEKVNISAVREDNTASVSGAGEKELTEGGNKFNIVVTAQKGNSKTYVINITRKELNPITVNVNNKSYTLVRKKDLLPSLNTFVETTVNYDGEEIPGLKNETINYTLIGLKDADGNIGLYVYNDNKITDEYFELTSGSITILPKSSGDVSGLSKADLFIKGHKIAANSLSNSNTYIIKGINVYSGEESYYMYDKVNEIFISYDKTNIEQVLKKYNMMKIGGITLCIVVVLLIVLVLINKFKGNKKDKTKDDEINVEKIDSFEEDIKEEKKEEIREEIKEEIIEEKKEEEKEEKLSKKAQKKLVKEEKRKKREQEELEKTKALEQVEEVEEETPEEDNEVDDPLNDDDNFVDFWETREYKVKGKKKE